MTQEPCVTFRTRPLHLRECVHNLHVHVCFLHPLHIRKLSYLTGHFVQSIFTRSGVLDESKNKDVQLQQSSHHQRRPFFDNETCGKCNLIGRTHASKRQNRTRFYPCVASRLLHAEQSHHVHKVTHATRHVILLCIIL